MRSILQNAKKNKANKQTKTIKTKRIIIAQKELNSIEEVYTNYLYTI